MAIHTIDSASFDDAANLRRLDGHALVAVTASRQLGERLELFGRIENLFDKGVEPKRPVGRPPGTGAKRAGPSAWITGSPGALKAWGKGPHCKLFLGLFTDNATALAACEAFERGEDLV